MMFHVGLLLSDACIQNLFRMWNYQLMNKMDTPWIGIASTMFYISSLVCMYLPKEQSSCTWSELSLFHQVERIVLGSKFFEMFYISSLVCMYLLEEQSSCTWSELLLFHQVERIVLSSKIFEPMFYF